MAAPDPVEDVEQALRKMATGNCKAMLTKLIHGIDKVPNTARVLRLIEVVASLHRQALSNFGTETAPMRRNGLLYSTPNNGLLSEDSLGTDSSLGVIQGSYGGNTGETFSAQLATQFLSGIKQTTAPQGISHLVSALAEAKEAGLDDVVVSIRAKLDLLLAAGPAGPKAAPEKKSLLEEKPSEKKPKRNSKGKKGDGLRVEDRAEEALA